jgi:methionyl aminopeptidase
VLSAATGLSLSVGDAGTGMELKAGMVLAIEPMFTLGTPRVKLMSDGYTYVTRDDSRAAHWEHTILITDGPAEILTALK